ncbi:MAG: SUMF1/EgtB/PvdO family nonheme iron enzyme [Anaerolineae bacterium]
MSADALSNVTVVIYQTLRPFITPLLVDLQVDRGTELPHDIAELWKVMRPHISVSAEIQRTLRELKDAPEDHDLQGEFRSLLRRAFRENPSFAEQVLSVIGYNGSPQSLLGKETHQPKIITENTDRPTSNGILAGPVTESIVVQGNNNKVVFHKPVENMGKPSFETLRQSYLNQLFDSTSFVSTIDPLFASDNKTRLNLAAVYTDLSTETPLPQGHDPYKGKKDVPKVTALGALNRHPRLVLLGEPGSGKSTFVNFVCMCFAGEALGRPEANLGRLMESATVNNVESKHILKAWEHGWLLPVRVILRDFAANSALSPSEEGKAAHLLQFIQKQLKLLGIGDFAPLLRSELLKRGGLVLLDGMDEVPGGQHLRTQIRSIIESFASSFPKCRIAVTSRTYAYQKQEWYLPDFTEAVLAPFSHPQILRFVDKWYDHYAAKGGTGIADARGRAHLLKEVLLHNERLIDLAQTPLLLTLIISLHAMRQGNLPEEREKLYASAVELLLERWESTKMNRDAKGNASIQHLSLSAWLKVDRSKVRRFLNELAFRAHAEHPGLSETPDIPQEVLVNGLLGLSGNHEVDPSHLVDYLSKRTGLLVSRGVNIYAFPHRTFQEYLAACYLTEYNYPYDLAHLVRENPGLWREATMLAGAKAAQGTPFALWALVNQLCYRISDEKACDRKDEWGALLAAQLVVECAASSNPSEPDLRKIEDICKWMVHLIEQAQFPAAELVRAGEYLGRLGDLRFRQDRWHLPDEPLWGLIEIPAGPFQMGSDPARDRDSSEDEWPSHVVTLPLYYIGRYPVTVAQFRAFIQDSGYDHCEPDVGTGPDNRPVTNVSWHAAQAYCNWLQTKLQGESLVPTQLGTLLKEKWRVTLPSEAEWEKAARGNKGYIFPWGNRYQEDHANIGETGIGCPSPVGCFVSGKSPYGLLDMGGNVWEWTRSVKRAYPYVPEDSREDETVHGERALRGGSFDDLRRVCRCASRDSFLPDGRQVYYGFRIALCQSK